VTRRLVRRALARLALAGGAVDVTTAAHAVREELAPLLGARGLGADPAAAALLRRAHHECLARNLLLERLARPALMAVRARAIPVLLLKGAALLRGTFAPGARTLWDIDVLVPAARWREAIAALLGLGLAPLEIPGRYVATRHDYVRAFALGGDATLELHRHVGPRSQFRVDLAGLFARARRDDDGLLVPDPIDLFLTLALHAAKHGFVLPLRSFVDGLVLAPAVDPATMVARADAWNARRALSVWLAILLDLGLDHPAWRAAAAARPAPAVTHAILEDDDPIEGSWRFQLRVARLLDGLRPALWLTERTALRVADAIAARAAP
jgi:hypothetical protein